MVRHWIAYGLLSVTLVGLLGCAQDPAPVVVHPVSGQIFYGEKPAVGVRVFLLPTSAPIPPQIPANPRGITDRDGKFQLTTFGNEDGAAPGGYQVILDWPPPSGETEEQTTDILLGWYDAVHSRLNVEIKDGPNQLKAFHLPIRTQPPGPSEGVPGRN